jgi:hypothetical protein
MTRPSTISKPSPYHPFELAHQSAILLVKRLARIQEIYRSSEDTDEDLRRILMHLDALWVEFEEGQPYIFAAEPALARSRNNTFECAGITGSSAHEVVKKLAYHVLPYRNEVSLAVMVAHLEIAKPTDEHLRNFVASDEFTWASTKKDLQAAIPPFNAERLLIELDDELRQRTSTEEHEEPEVSLKEQDIRRIAEAACDPQTSTVLQIANRTDLTGEEKMMELLRADNRFEGKTSKQWSELLQVKEGTIRGYDTWKSLQARKDAD